MGGWVHQPPILFHPAFVNFIFVFMAMALGWSGCQRPYQDPTSPLPASGEAAIRLLPRIEGDLDRRGSYVEQVALALADLGYMQRAMLMVAEDPTIHGPNTLYRLAIRMGHQGRMSEGRKLVAQAAQLAETKGAGSARMVMIQAATARAAVGQMTDAKRIVSLISTPYDRQEAEAGMVAEMIRQGQAGPEAAAPLATPSLTEAWCARARKARPGDQIVFLEKAAANARLTFPVQRPRLLALCALTAVELRRKEQAEVYLREAEFTAAVLSDRIEDGPIEKAKVALALARAGQGEKAREILARARTGSRLPASFFQPPALARVAEAYWALGDQSTAEEVWLEAAQNAKGHIHPNARVINSIEIHLSYLRAGTEPSPMVTEVLAAMERGQGGDGAVSVPPEVEKMQQKIQKMIREEPQRTKKKPLDKP
jgi:hypothetical protein